ncbi:MAG: hypothetical protein KDB23_21040 [Planctomycetales bacterium]|nr:hypothetical protein [Planctomycetales bacterium]
MDPRGLRNLEEELEAAIAETLDEMRLPIEPTPHIIHLMAKAAATVFEAAVETEQPRR